MKLKVYSLMMVLTLLLIADTQGQWQAGLSNKDWKFFQQGSGKATIEHDSKKRNHVRLRLEKGDLAGIRENLPQDKWVAAAASTTGSVTAGTEAGVFLNTPDGALLRLTVFQQNGDRQARFRAMAGKKSYGQRDVDITDNGTCQLQMIRRGDVFVGRLAVGDGAYETIASLDWPGLKTGGTGGLLAECPSGGKGPVFAELHDFTLIELSNVRTNVSAYCRIGGYDAAEEAIVTAQDVLGDHVDFHRFRSWVAAARGDVDAVIKQYRKMLQMEPDNVSTMNDLGYTLIEAGRDLDEAIGLLEKVVVAKPNDPLYLDSLAWGYFKLNRLDEAATIQQKAFDIECKRRIDHHPVLFDHLLAIYRKREDTEAQNKVYEAYLAALKKYEGKIEDMDYRTPIRKALCHQQLKHKKEALANARMAQKVLAAYPMLPPDLIEAYEMLGDVFVGLNKSTNAMTVYKQGLDIAKQQNRNESVERLKSKIMEAL